MSLHLCHPQGPRPGVSCPLGPSCGLHGPGKSRVGSLTPWAAILPCWQRGRQRTCRLTLSCPGLRALNCPKVSFMCESGWAATPGIQPNPSSTWLPGCFADVIEVHGGLAPVRKGARDRLGRCEDGLRRLAPEQLQLQRPPAKRARPPSRLLSWRHSFSPSRPAVM